MKRIVFVLFFAFSLGLFAQNKLELKPAIGAYLGLNYNMHSPSFNYIYTDNTGNPFAAKFSKSASSLGFNIGLMGNIPLDDMFALSLRLGYNQMNGKLDSITIPAGIEIKNELDAKIGYLEISPILQIHNLFDDMNLYFLAGLEFGVPLTKNYTHNQTTFQPSGTTSSTVTGEKDIPDASFRMAAAVGAGWVFELSEKVKLSPEVSFRIPFTKVSSNQLFDKWNISQLRAGVNLTFDIFSSDEKVKDEPVAKNLNVSISRVNSVTREGKREQLKVIRVEDMQYSELFPYLPYVFFDELAAEPSESVQVMSSSSEAGKFNMASLESDAIFINSRTLDILGVRMQQNPSASITITGTNDNKKEKTNKTISSARADFAKNYLVKNFNIAENRITVKAAGLPEKPSSSNVADGIAENRRIEITGNDKKLFEPIIISGENQRVAAPDLIEFVPNVTTNDSITSWNLQVFQGGNTLKAVKGYNTPAPMQWAISPNALANKQLPCEYTFTVETASGLERKFKGTIPVEYVSTSKKKTEDLPDKTISKYSLVLFDFDKAEVSAADMEIIEKHIIPAIKFNSTVDIYGYTDRIGDDAYNQKLAEKRANAVMKVLQAKIASAKYNVHGVGESVSIFDNESTVGRQLSRTVQIYISTPKK